MTHRVVESISELSATMKAGALACSERDAGFCSGGDEDDMSDLHSPSASEDSLEVRVTPISSKNKRKLAEPRKFQEANATPLKKRRLERIEMAAEEESSGTTRSSSPFRPWSCDNKGGDSKVTGTTMDDAKRGDSSEDRCPNRYHHRRHHHHRHHRHRHHRESDEDETVALENRQTRQESVECTKIVSSSLEKVSENGNRLQEEPLSLVLRDDVAGRVPSHPGVDGSYEKSHSMDRANVSPSSSTSSSSSSSSSSASSLSASSLSASSSSSSSSTSSFASLNRQETHRSCSSNENSATRTMVAEPIPRKTTNLATPTTTTNSQLLGQNSTLPRQHNGGTSTSQQRNYKNMTRERRIEANARERTRVHTISAAFDTLRRAIPAYSHNQKLSKLSVLRIACSYIMTLGKIVNTPEDEPANGASLGACVDLVSRTIQTEGKLRKRKED